MLNCKEVSKLVSESFDRKLSWWQRVNLWVHLSMCEMCSGFRKDVTHIREETRQHDESIVDDDADSDVKLSDDSRDRMNRLLESRTER